MSIEWNINHKRQSKATIYSHLNDYALSVSPRYQCVLLASNTKTLVGSHAEQAYELIRKAKNQVPSPLLPLSPSMPTN